MALLDKYANVASKFARDAGESAARAVFDNRGTPHDHGRVVLTLEELAMILAACADGTVEAVKSEVARAAQLMRTPPAGGRAS